MTLTENNQESLKVDKNKFIISEKNFKNHLNTYSFSLKYKKILHIPFLPPHIENTDLNIPVGNAAKKKETCKNSSDVS